MPDPLRDVPQDAIELIKSFEGIPDGDPSTVNLDAYLDPIGIWTIGWGHAIRAPDGKDWLRGPPNKPVARSLYPGGISKPQAETLLHADLLDTTRDVLRLVKVPLNDGQLGGLLAFVFNLGAGSLASSTLLKLLNAADYAGAADQFLVWNKAKVNGVLTPMAGLTRRRTGERALFAAEDWRAASAARGAAPVATKKAVAKKAASKKAAAPMPGWSAPVKKAPVKKVAAQRLETVERGRGGTTAGKKALAAKKTATVSAPSAKATAEQAPARQSAVKKAAARTAPVKKAAAKTAAAKNGVPTKKSAMARKAAKTER